MGNRPQLLSGARGELKVNGKTIAFITEISIEVSHNVRAVHTFGAPNARSVEPLQAGPCTVSIGRVIPVNDSKGQAVDTSMIATGVEPTILQMLSADDIVIDLHDKITNTTYASVRNCRFANRSFSVSASNLASERISLIGIYDAGRTVGGAPQNSTGPIGF